MLRTVLIIFISFLLFSFLFSSKNIDPRLMMNPRIAIKSQDHYLNNPDEYLFMVYELDNAYFIREMNTLNEPQKKSLKSIETIVDINGNPFDVAVLNDLTTFNFHLYNFERNENRTIAYDLQNGKILGFYSQEKLREMFTQNTTTE